MSMDAFFTIHRDLHREGPGSTASTKRALEMVTDLPADPIVLDAGCGPGAQTMVLAEALPTAQIIAVDLHEPFVAEVSRRAHAAGVGDRVRAVVGDIAALPEVLAAEGVSVVDLLWSEGAAYSIGFERALALWRPLLASGGYLALTEAVWIAPGVPRMVKDFWDREYPDMQPVQVRRAQVAAAGYRRVGDFTLPASDWEAYYTPIRARLDDLRGDPSLDEAIAAHDEEIAVFDSGGATGVGYQFIVARRS